MFETENETVKQMQVTPFDKLLAIIKSEKDGYQEVSDNVEYSRETRGRAQSLADELAHLERVAHSCKLPTYVHVTKKNFYECDT